MLDVRLNDYAEMFRKIYEPEIITIFLFYSNRWPIYEQHLCPHKIYEIVPSRKRFEDV